MTELCRVCKKVNGSLVCPCGRYIFCSPDCLQKSGHLYECDYQKITFPHMVSIMHSFVPIMDAVSDDKDLYGAAKGFMELLRKKLNDLTIESRSTISKDL